MANATINAICEVCGREFCHTKEFRSRKQADNYENYMKHVVSICSDCYAKQKKETEAARRKKKNERAAELALAENWAPLKGGSEKQIAWAETIRRDFFDKQTEVDKNFKCFLLENVTAAEWIENRNDLARFIINTYAPKYKAKLDAITHNDET